MEYTLLPQNLKYDTLANNIRAREVEYWQYDFDKTNFISMLAGDISDAYRAELTQRLDSTQVQMDKVKSIHAALLAQIDDEAAYAAAVARLRASAE